MNGEKPTITLELTIDEVNLVLTALGQLPYVQVVGILENIRRQAEGQLTVTEESHKQK